MWTNGQGYRQDRRHGDWDTSDKKHQQIVNSISICSVLDGVHPNDLNNHSNSNWTYTEVTNGRQYLVEANQISKA